MKEQTTEFLKKIQVIKATIGKLQKNQMNPHFGHPYFDINEILEHLEPALEDQNLILMQPIEDGKVVSRIIDIDTKEYIESVLELHKYENPQKMGSAITYYRRYSLQSLLSLQAEDDDGNIASGKQKKKDSVPKEDKVWLTPDQFEKSKEGTAQQIQNLVDKYDGNKFCMKKAYRTELMNLITEKLKNEK